MIEYCTKKIMIITVAGMILVSVLILFFEDALSPPPSLIGKKDLANLLKNSSDYSHKGCKEKENYKVFTKCTKCTEFEMKSGLPSCRPSGYKQQVNCVSTGTVWLNCSGDMVDQRRHFFIFEGTLALLGIASYVVVYQRQRRLNRLLMEKVNRQIGAGV